MLNRVFKFIKIVLLILTLIYPIINVADLYSATIDKVEIEGNKRVPESRITPYILSVGTEFNLQALDESIKNLYKTGLFLNIDGDLYVDGNKFVLKYKIEEMPLIGAIKFTGNKEKKSKTLLEKVTLKVGQQLNFSSLERSLEALGAYYDDENRYGTKVSFRIEKRTVNSITLYFDINEADKSKIYNIFVYGNDNISIEKIKSSIPTKERHFWSFISGSGKISKDTLLIDREIIRMLYLERGYAQVSLSEPELEVDKDDLSKVTMSIRIKEGDQYSVRSVEWEGYENISLDKIKEITKLKAGDIFNVRVYQEDIMNITDLYTSSGYAYANVEPIISLDEESKTVDIVYRIEENTLVKIGRIVIKGNKSSHDNVIRRQIDQMEGELYNSTLIKEAKANTMATGFYENVQIIEKSAGKDVIDLEVDVIERSTGSFTVGAAFSSIDGIMGMIQLSRNNFFGLGHSVSLRGEVSKKRMDFSFSYTDPWLFDWPISAGVDIFSLEREWYEYKRRSTGGAIRLGHSIIKRRLFANYRISLYEVNIFDIKNDASIYVKEQKGKTRTHSISPALIWNSLNNAIDPSDGNKSQIYVDFAGLFLGGDAHYVKVGTETSQYIPLFSKIVLRLHGELGYVVSTKKDSKIPIDDRFRLGGINSVRGFELGEISPKDKDGRDYGGDKYFLANVELIFPIKEDIKLKGLIFFDIGQVYAEGENLFGYAPRESVGVGLRWLTPMGPFRLEWGYKLDKKSGEQPFRFDFSIGGTF